MTQPNEDVKGCKECAGQCGLVCECSDCDCKHIAKAKLSKETAALVAEFSHRETGA